MCTLYNIATLPKNFSFELVENELEETDTLGIRIRKLRKSKNLTSKELGDLIGITGAGIIGYENNKSYPSRKVLLKLVDVLGTEVLCDDYSKFIITNYGLLLNRWRKNNNLTYIEAAEKLHISEGLLSSWEGMKKEVSRGAFERNSGVFIGMIAI